MAAACGIGEGKAGGLPLALRYVGALGGELGWDSALEALTVAGEDVELGPSYHPHEDPSELSFI